MKKLVVFLLLLLLMITLALPASAAKATVVIDNAELIVVGDEQYIARISGSCNCSFGEIEPFVVTGTESYAPDNATVRSICGLNKDSDAIVLYIRLLNGTYYYDMYTFGRAYDAFSDSEVDAVLDDPDVYNNLKAGKIERGYRAFYEACHPIVNRYYSDYLDGQAARAKRAPFVALAIGAGSGVVVAGITVLCVFLAYRKKQHGESYPLDRYAKLDLTQANDIFVGSHITRVRVNTNSSSGGRSGGGGGGGHRGGR